MKTLQKLLTEKKAIERRASYASRQGWATEVYIKELDDNKKSRIQEASKINALSEHNAY